MAGFTDPDYQAWKAEQVRNNLQSRNQFRGITDYEPFDIVRNPFDNPPFIWPAKQYTDSTGNQIKVQRGYMRSLLTDPRWPISESAKNRRLFFQFNPTVLVRSVQQSVGAMSPLLQDPAQLVQPVPGTATFGFELLFNREKEVASGYSYAPGEAPSFDDMMVLPNGDAAIASQIGVLADIMVLDTITGQGISKDMLDILDRQAQEQANSAILSQEERIKILGEDGDNDSEVALEQSNLDELKEKVSTLSDRYALNIGNQAFLNPLPFRVLFSSLFMVEGVATSVEVQYQKFSATMIPTQCKVIINMYALYLGFASKDTYLTKGYESAFQSAVKETVDTNATAGVLSGGIQKFSYNLRAGGGKSELTGGLYPPAELEIGQFKEYQPLQNYIKEKKVADVKMVAYFEAVLSNNQFPSETELSSTRFQLDTYDYEAMSKNSGDITIYIWKHPTIQAITSADIGKYFTYRFSFELIASVDGNTISSGIQHTTTLNLGTNWTTSIEYGVIGSLFNTYLAKGVATGRATSGGARIQ